MSNIPVSMRRYFWRLALFLSLYMAALIGGLTIRNGYAALPPSYGIALALLTALPIVGIFWTIFRLLTETEDEYQRLLLVKQVLLATALTLGITTFWQFLVVYDVTADGPQWIGVIWLALFGFAAPLVRLRA
jgi:hypothetical protein